MVALIVWHETTIQSPASKVKHRSNLFQEEQFDRGSQSWETFSAVNSNLTTSQVQSPAELNFRQRSKKPQDMFHELIRWQCPPHISIGYLGS